MSQQSQSSLRSLCKHKKAKRNYRFSETLILSNVILGLLMAKLAVNLARHLTAPVSPDEAQPMAATQATQANRADSAWASSIGELPTAAEVYGESSAELPSTETFDDDDEDEELDASATNEYPDNDTESTDESYEEPEDGQESSRVERWLGRPDELGHARVGPETSALASEPKPRARRARRQAADDDIGPSVSNDEIARPVPVAPRADEMDAAFNVDDGDEDAWVHDGVDDIQIDPETRRAATELSYDQEPSIDAEYDPHGPPQSGQAGALDDDAEPIVNRTRVTTISEVIPTRVDEDASKTVERFVVPPETVILSDQSSLPADTSAPKASAGRPSQYVPASQLSFDQVLRALGAN